MVAEVKFRGLAEVNLDIVFGSKVFGGEVSLDTTEVKLDADFEVGGEGG